MPRRNVLANPLSVRPHAFIVGALLLAQGCFDPEMKDRPGGATDTSVGETDTAPGSDPTMSGSSPTQGETDDAGPGSADTNDTTEPDDASATMSDTAEPSDSSGGSDDSSSSDDDTSPTDPSGGADCGAGTMCIAVPAGWNGPIAAHEAAGDAAVPECAGEFNLASLLGYEGLLANAASCGCECEAPADVECPAATLTQYDDQTNCTIQSPDSTFNLAEACNEIGFFDDVLFRLNVPDLDLDGVTCTPNATENVPALGWTTQLAGCGLADAPATCDGGACIPSPEEGELCVWLDGDQECPAGDFSEKALIHRDADDTRECSACHCGDPEGSCAATMTLYAGTACSAGSPGSGGDGECVSVDTPARSVRYEVDGAEVSCAPSNSTAIGSATPTDPVTVCCMAG